MFRSNANSGISLTQVTIDIMQGPLPSPLFIVNFFCHGKIYVKQHCQVFMLNSYCKVQNHKFIVLNSPTFCFYNFFISNINIHSSSVSLHVYHYLKVSMGTNSYWNHLFHALFIFISKGCFHYIDLITTDFLFVHLSFCIRDFSFAFLLSVERHPVSSFCF